MNKIKALAIITTFFSSIVILPTSWAIPVVTAADAPALSQGFYLGGELGYDYAKIYENFSFPFTTSHGPSQLDGYAHSAATGFVGGGLIGYGKMLTNKLYLGTEILANGSQASTKNQATYSHFHDTGLYDHDGYSNVISFKNNVGISFLPGFQANKNNLFYGRLGYSLAHVSSTENVIFYGQPFNLPLTTTPYTNSYSPSGFSYGLGFETAFINQLSVRGEFIHTDYRSFTTLLGNQISIADNQAMIGLLYHFKNA